MQPSANEPGGHRELEASEVIPLAKKAAAQQLSRPKDKRSAFRRDLFGLLGLMLSPVLVVFITLTVTSFEVHRRLEILMWIIVGVIGVGLLLYYIGC